MDSEKRAKTFLCVLLLCLFISSASALASARQAEQKGDGRLTLYNYQTGEMAEETYREGGVYDATALKRINRLMRSPDDKVYPISVSLIEILDLIEDHFQTNAVEIISGYRSPKYNSNLRENGRDAAKSSLHMKGMAADIHIDEVTEKAVMNYAISLKKGGVGYYPKFNFVHVDVGNVRSWEENPPKERILIGTEANPNKSWRVVTDKNEYKTGEKISATITNVGYETMPLTKNIWREHFQKGKWATHEILEKKDKVYKLKAGGSVTLGFGSSEMPYGKFRLVVFTSKDFNVPPAVSNEFYIKRE